MFITIADGGDLVLRPSCIKFRAQEESRRPEFQRAVTPDIPHIRRGGDETVTCHDIEHDHELAALQLQHEATYLIYIFEQAFMVRGPSYHSSTGNKLIPRLRF